MHTSRGSLVHLSRKVASRPNSSSRPKKPCVWFRSCVSRPIVMRAADVIRRQSATRRPQEPKDEIPSAICEDLLKRWLALWTFRAHQQPRRTREGFQNAGSCARPGGRAFFWFTRARKYQIVLGFATDWWRRVEHSDPHPDPRTTGERLRGALRPHRPRRVSRLADHPRPPPPRVGPARLHHPLQPRAPPPRARSPDARGR